MPDWNTVTEGIKALWEMLFGQQVPLWVPRLLAWAVVGWIFVTVVHRLLLRMIEIWETWDERVRPRFYNEAERRRSETRQHFATRLNEKLSELADSEAWQDFRFTELEAEVEAEGERRVPSVLPWRRTQSGLRREKSLSKALKSSKEKIVLLEGDPGSGKSVALRHVAQEMAREAMEARSTRSLIPLYINLKSLDRAALAREIDYHRAASMMEPSRLHQILATYFNREELKTLAFYLDVNYDDLNGSGTSVKARELVMYMQHRGQMAALVSRVKEQRPYLFQDEADTALPPIDGHLIRAFVQHTFSWNSYWTEVLESEFQRGLEEGSWFFLFDSFDELPNVLGSTEEDDTIQQYARAIDEFLRGMGRCRGIVASRHFRGPNARWPRFRILPLTEERRHQLIRRADLKPEVESDLRGQLGMASEAIRAQVSNPMFLGMLCERMRQGERFPHNTHEVFEGYIKKRLERDCERLERRFGLDLPAVRSVAESVAFAMAADTTLGLSPTRAALSAAIQRLGLAMPAPLEPTLDALEYIKLGRAEGTAAQGEEPRFTFAHRRFQEYFATSIVLRDPQRMPPRRLLTDARWRETAVVLCQTQPLPVLQPLLDEARALLDGMLEEVKEYLVDVEEVLAEENISKERKEEALKAPPIIFPWPARSIHLLGLLQDGFGGRREELADDIRDKAGLLVLSGSERGILLDRKWALEVAGSVPQLTLLYLLRDAYSSGSQFLQQIAYWQVAQLQQIPEDIVDHIRKALFDLAVTKRLEKEFLTITTHLSRLKNSERHLALGVFLKNTIIIDRFLQIALLCAITITLITLLNHELYIMTALILSQIAASSISLTNQMNKVATNSDIIDKTMSLWMVSASRIWSIFIVSIISKGVFWLIISALINYWPIITLLSAKSSKNNGGVTGWVTSPFILWDYSLQNLRSIGLAFTYILAIFALFSPFFLLIMTQQYANNLNHLINYIIYFSIICLSAILSKIFYLPFAKSLIAQLSDMIRLKSHLKKRESADIAFVIDCITTYRYDSVRIDFLRKFNKSSLPSNKMTPKILQNTILLVQCGIKLDKDCKKLILLGDDLTEDKFSAFHTQAQESFTNSEAELLDELCRLLEHIRANRRVEDDAASAAPALPHPHEPQG